MTNDPHQMYINEMYSYTEHECCGLDSFEVTGKHIVFTLSFGQTEKRTDGQLQSNMPLIFRCGGIKRVAKCNHIIPLCTGCFAERSCLP